MSEVMIKFAGNGGAQVASYSQHANPAVNAMLASMFLADSPSLQVSSAQEAAVQAVGGMGTSGITAGR